MKILYRAAKAAILIGFGLALGWFLFSGVQPRHFLQITSCTSNCLNEQELAGLLVSIGVQKTPTLIPKKIYETDKTVVLQHPFPETPTHLLIVPKKDIRNIADVSIEDQAYIMDALAVIHKLVAERHLNNYQVITNGPGQQQVSYLHFHLMAQETSN